LSNKLVIPGTLPTMNEIVDVSKKHWARYSAMKGTYTRLVALHASKLPKMDKVDVTITWYCKNRRQDKDNVMAGQKFIFDGLVSAGKLANDGWGQIGNVTHRFEVDKKNPRVEIELMELQQLSGS
jgi:Holliday junction resolvase RusA-like endonuclease